ncbi:hypothetical protein SAMN02745866_04262 [Alteromonadaceae bacterium Bs31]|nr:hypothetical protein SAMN02745866_04262 [Alteromonadaceae bacterium Bs31]
MSQTVSTQRFSLSAYLVLILLCLYSMAAGTTLSHHQQLIDIDHEQAHSGVPKAANYGHRIKPLSSNEATPNVGNAQNNFDTAVISSQLCPPLSRVKDVLQSTPVAPAYTRCCILPPLRAPPRV